MLIKTEWLFDGCTTFSARDLGPIYVDFHWIGDGEEPATHGTMVQDL